MKFARGLNIYQACVPDRMHHIDLGLFKYQLDFTQQILKEVGGTELQWKFDRCLHEIPRFSGLKLFNKLGKLKLMTTANYRNLIKIVLFAMDDIFDIWNQVTCIRLCKLFESFSKMYIMSRQVAYTETDLENFEVILLVLVKF